MNMNNRIEKIKSYFVTLNVSDGAICVIVKLPSTWVLCDEKILKDSFNVIISKQQDDTYFVLTELQNGFDCTFDCIEYIINLNKSIEEKRALLDIKGRELSELFINEPLEKLKTLRFVFDEPTNKKNGKKKTQQKQIKNEIEEKVNNVAEETEEVQEVQNETIESETLEENNNEVGSSLLNLAMQITNV